MTAAVFDCMIFLQAAANKHGAAAACLDLVERGEVGLFLSPTILAELRDVFRRPSVRRKLPTLTNDVIDLFLAKVAARAVVIDTVPTSVRLPRDVKDEPYINLALAVRADFLVSRDKDLISLANDTAFRTEHPDMSIINPEAFLDQVRPRTKNQAA